jgi:hypothetical protein
VQNKLKIYYFFNVLNKLNSKKYLTTLFGLLIVLFKIFFKITSIFPVEVIYSLLKFTINLDKKIIKFKYEIKIKSKFLNKVLSYPQVK